VATTTPSFSPRANQKEYLRLLLGPVSDPPLTPGTFKNPDAVLG